MKILTKHLIKSTLLLSKYKLIDYNIALTSYRGRMVDQAVLDKLEAGFKKLSEANDCHSLLKKYLTRDVFDKLKTRKTAMGATLLDVIQSGNY